MTVTADIDVSGFNKGFAFAKEYTKRTVSEVMNTSAYWVAVNFKQVLPFVTPQTIDSQLKVIKQDVIGKRGKVLKNKKKYVQFTGGGVPVAALIIAARANPSSRYNQLTNSRYKLPKNPFKGVSRATGQAAMAALIDYMIKKRHSSGKFLIAGIIPAIRTLYPLSKQKFIKGGFSPRSDFNAARGQQKGFAIPAREGETNVTATIESDIGMTGRNAESHNRALLTIGTPLLQRAADNEGAKNMQYALDKMAKELESGVNKHWS